MKRLYFSFLVIIAMAFQSMSQIVAAPAEIIMQGAYRQATKENKNVFVMFHASWCGWCHKMDASMNDADCSQFFKDNYVIVHLVVDESKGKEHLQNPGAPEFRKKYNGNEQGIPFWLVFDKEGNLLADSKMRKADEAPELGENTGCPATEKEVEYFISVLKKTSTLNQQQAEVIKKRFRKNEVK